MLEIGIIIAVFLILCLLLHYRHVERVAEIKYGNRLSNLDCKYSIMVIHQGLFKRVGNRDYTEEEVIIELDALKSNPINSGFRFLIFPVVENEKARPNEGTVHYSVE